MARYGKGEAGTTMVEIAVGLAVGALLVAGVLTLLQQAQKSYLHTSEATDLQQNVRVGMDRVTRAIQAAGVNPLNLPLSGATPNNPAFTAFREAGRNCIRIYADLNGDGDLNVGGDPDESDENLYFFWSTTSPSSLLEQRGTQAGQPDSGAAWVADGGAAQELARDIVTNPSLPPAPNSTATFRYFTGINDPLGAPNTELFPPGASTTTCASLNAAARERIARVVVTLTGRASIGRTGTSSFEVMNKTLTSDARARNVP
jgi:Tfp pilus assembly protein PilW